MAEIATGQREEALDIAQDSMLKLVERYAERPEEEWGPLLHRIVQHRIRDWYRRHRVRQRFRIWPRRESEDEEASDPLESLRDPTASDPERELGEARAMGEVERSLRELPLRQQQAFLLRAWEGLDVRQTARAMGCSEGSVKTHYHRALNGLRKRLGKEGGE